MIGEFTGFLDLNNSLKWERGGYYGEISWICIIYFSNLYHIFEISLARSAVDAFHFFYFSSLLFHAYVP